MKMAKIWRREEEVGSYGKQDVVVKGKKQKSDKTTSLYCDAICRK